LLCSSFWRSQNLCRLFVAPLHLQETALTDSLTADSLQLRNHAFCFYLGGWTKFEPPVKPFEMWVPAPNPPLHLFFAKILSKIACQSPQRPKIPITNTPSTTSLRKIVGILDLPIPL
jgi:hypothetical protein